MKGKLIVISLFLLALTAITECQHENLVIHRISVHGKTIVDVKPGETVKLAWKVDIDKVTRKERLDLFYCGYRDKGQLIPLVYTYGTHIDKFFSTATKTPPVSHNLMKDPNGLDKRVTAYRDNTKQLYVMEIANVDLDFDNKLITCSLSYKTDYASDSAAGGDIRIRIRKDGSVTKKDSVGKKPRSSKMFLLGTMMASCIIGLAFLLAWLCKRKQYDLLPTDEPRGDRDAERNSTRRTKLRRPRTPVKSTTHRNAQTKPQRPVNGPKYDVNEIRNDSSKIQSRLPDDENRESTSRESSRSRRREGRTSGELDRKQGRSTRESSRGTEGRSRDHSGQSRRSKQPPQRPSEPPVHDEDIDAQTTYDNNRTQLRRNDRAAPLKHSSNPTYENVQHSPAPTYENVQAPGRSTAPKPNSSRRQRSVSRERNPI